MKQVNMAKVEDTIGLGFEVKQSSQKTLTCVSTMEWRKVEGGCYCLINNYQYENDEEEFQDWSAINITDTDAIGVRDWLLNVYPLSKQELVDMMTEIAKGSK